MSTASSQGSSAWAAFPQSQKLLLTRQLADPGAASGEAPSPPGSCSPHTRPKCARGREAGWCAQPGTAMLDPSPGLSEALLQPGRRAELEMSPDPTPPAMWEMKHQSHSKEWPPLVTTGAQTHFPAFCGDTDPAKPQEPPRTAQARQSPAHSPGRGQPPPALHSTSTPGRRREGSGP